MYKNNANDIRKTQIDGVSTEQQVRLWLCMHAGVRRRQSCRVWNNYHTVTLHYFNTSIFILIQNSKLCNIL